jgi:hypothetical protein
MPESPLTSMLVVLGDPPEGSAHGRAILRVVLAMLRWYPRVEFLLVLRGEAARALLEGIPGVDRVPPRQVGEQSVAKVLEGIAYRRGTIAVQDDWLAAAGLTRADLPRGTEVCTATEVRQLAFLADGVVAF